MNDTAVNDGAVGQTGLRVELVWARCRMECGCLYVQAMTLVAHQPLAWSASHRAAGYSWYSPMPPTHCVRGVRWRQREAVDSQDFNVHLRPLLQVLYQAVTGTKLRLGPDRTHAARGSTCWTASILLDMEEVHSLNTSGRTVKALAQRNGRALWPSVHAVVRRRATC